MRRTLAVLAFMAVVSAAAACGDSGSPKADGASSPAQSANTQETTAGPKTDPVCADVARALTDTDAAVQAEMIKGAAGTDAQLDAARQTVKKLYTSLSDSAKAAADKKADPQLKTALEAVATEATNLAAGLDAQQHASTALALMDRAKLNTAAEQVRQICGQS